VVLALAALIAVTAFLLAGIAGYGSRVGTVGLRDFLRTADATASSLQVQTRLSGNAAAQQRAADGLFDTLFTGLHVSVYRSMTLPPVPVTATSQSPDAAPPDKPTIRLASFDDLRAHAHLLSGSWPDLDGAPGTGDQAAARPAALQQSAAQALGVRVGDTVSIGNTDRITFSVDAIWAPDTPGDAFFTADASAARGATALAADRSAAGFLVVPNSVLAAKGSSTLLNWTIVPDADHLVPAEMLAMSAAVDKVPDAVTGSRAMAPHGSVSAGGLADTLRVVTSSVTASQAVSPVPSLLVAAISLLMLIQLARLLAVERRAETALIRSRGASAGQLTRIAVGEAVLVALPAAAIGAGVAVGVLGLSGARVPLTGWVQAALVALVAIGVITLPAARQARLPANRQQIDDSGRIRALAATSTVLLVLIAAGVSLWRFLRAGSALVVAEDGSTTIDPIAVLAPALTLIAGAVLAGVVFGLLAGLAEAISSRSRGLTASLATRQVARRGTVFGTVVVLVAIAIGGVGIAATYAPTQAVTQTQTDVLAGGAPLLATLPTVDPMIGQPYSRPSSAGASALAAVGTALPVLHRQVKVADLAASLLGVDIGRAPEVTAAAPGSFEPDRLTGLLAEDPGGVPVPNDATALTLEVSVAAAWNMVSSVSISSDGTVNQQPGGDGPSGMQIPVDITIWLMTADGALTPVATDGIPALPVAPSGDGTPRQATLSVPLPHLAADSRLVAVDLGTPSLSDPLQVTLTVTEASARTPAGDRRLDLGSADWTAAPQPNANNGLVAQLSTYQLSASRTDTGLSGTVPAGQINVARLTADGPQALPIAVDRQLADALQLTLGQNLTVELDSARQIPAQVVAISPVLPGDSGTPTALADLPALQLMLLRSTPDLPSTTEIWAAPGHPAAAATALRPLIPVTSIITLANTRSAQALTAPVSFTLWFGAAGALLLAAIGVGSVVAGLSLSRRGELVVLRSVGVTARAQGRSRRGELLVTTLTGWLLGLVVAVAAVLTTVIALAGSAVVGTLAVTPTLHVAWLLAALLASAHVLVVVAVIAVHGRRVRRQALRSSPSELVI
jgi:hypothetical protein